MLECSRSRSAALVPMPVTIKHVVGPTLYAGSLGQKMEKV